MSLNTKLGREDAIIRLAAARGLDWRQIGLVLDASVTGVKLYCLRNGIEVVPLKPLPRMAKATKVLKVRGPYGTRPPTDRHITMMSMYRQGVSFTKIGQQFNCSRQYIQQVLKRFDVPVSEGGHRLIAKTKAAAKRQALEGRIMSHWGVSVDEWRALRANKTIARYERQKVNSSARGIAFELTFPQWLSIWKTSGKLELCGRGKGRYCMSRISDAGGYVMGNVHIQSCVQNSQEAVKIWKGKTKAYPGVFHLYPGRKMAWQAKVGKTRLGYFATEADAAQARADWLVKHPKVRTLEASRAAHRAELQAA